MQLHLSVKIDAVAWKGYISTMDLKSDCCPESCSDAAQRAWVQLIRAHRSALSSIERALRSADLPPLEWYDVLLELERGGALRPRDLQDRLLLAQYSLSRLLDRLEAEGLVARERCFEDARCQWVRATDAGKDLRRRTWPVYAAAIQEAVGGKLTDGQAQRLADLLSKISRAAT
jgi:DNA-binding MarR family transcriptional regulator